MERLNKMIFSGPFQPGLFYDSVIVGAFLNCVILQKMFCPRVLCIIQSEFLNIMLGNVSVLHSKQSICYQLNHQETVGSLFFIKYLIKCIWCPKRFTPMAVIGKQTVTRIHDSMAEELQI